MNKEGLIKLRDDLKNIRMEKNYTLISNIERTYDDEIRLEYRKDISEVIKLAKYIPWQNEIDALNYLQNSFEETLKNVFLSGENANSIISNLLVYFFASKTFSKELKNDSSKYLIPELEISKNMFLNQLVSISFFNYYSIEKYGMDTKLYDKQQPNSFIVNYDIFSKVVKQAGYDINIDNYNDLFENILDGNKPEIVLDFNEKIKIKK